MTSPVPAERAPLGGTVTLMFTDIEGSTRLLQDLGDRYAPTLAEHHRVLRDILVSHGGMERGSAGDGLYFVFTAARSAVLAAIEGQRAIAAIEWPDGVKVRDRVGLHTGEPSSGTGELVGLDVHRAARICAAGHGGQILMSQTTRELVADDLVAPLGAFDLGVHRLRDIDVPQRLFQVVAPGLERDFPPPRTTEAAPNNLGRELTSFIGREREIEQAIHALDEAPLLTLTGPGGVGKTRLGLRVATGLLGRFPDGIWVVELGGLTDPDFVASSVAQTIGAHELAGRPLLASIVDHLRAQRVLLLLDDCDRVLAACADLARALIQACPHVQLLATSREALGVPGEVIQPVPSLVAPDPSDDLDPVTLAAYDACRLFVERARAVQPSFELTTANARTVAQLCRRLDGIPLAIELAAARIRALPAEQIAAHLDDRFRLLTGGSRVAVARHQTLRATIDWSYELLTEPERIVLRRLSVFSGGASLEAAEAICQGGEVDALDVLDILSRLVDKSLVIADASGVEARFRLLESVREYAQGRLVEAAEANEIQRRHRDWYVTLVDQAAAAFFQGPEPSEWLRRLDREHDDLRAALEWCIDQPDEARAGLWMAAGLWRFWEIRGHLAEGRGWLERMIEAVGDEMSTLRANALTGAGSLAFMQGDFRAASTFHEESLRIQRQLGHPPAIAYAANNLANTALQLGDFERARALYEEGRDIVSRLGDVRATVFSTTNLADAVARQGDVDGARTLYEGALQVIRDFGDQWIEAFVLDAYGSAIGRAGDRESARSLHVEALGILESLGDRRGVARTLSHLADLALQDGDLDRALALLRQGLQIRQELGDIPGLATAMESLAGAIAVTDPEAAARLTGAAEALREAIRATIPPQAAAVHDQRLADLEARLGAETFDQARRQGRGMSPNEALATLPL